MGHKIRMLCASGVVVVREEKKVHRRNHQLYKFQVRGITICVNYNRAVPIN